MSFRDNLIHLRAANNMTQEQLAVLLGVSRQAVTKWESEKSYPEMDKLLKLCQIFNCTLDDLVQGDLTTNEPTQLPKVKPLTPPADVFDYDSTMRRFAWKISLGVALIIFGNALSLPFFNATDPAINPLFTLPENIATTLGMLFLFLGVIAGLALIIPAGLARMLTLCANTPTSKTSIRKKTNPARAALSASNSLEASPASSRAFARSFSLVKAPKTSSG